MSIATCRICPVNADLLSVDPITAAQRLVGAALTGRGVSAMIVEVEAYGGPPDGPWPDAASHSFRGRGPRNSVMFGPAGRLYTYRSHGIHVCANVVCATDGVAGAVLMRAAAVEAGLEVAHERRGDSTRPAQATCARPSESSWTTTELTCSTRKARCSWCSASSDRPSTVRASGSARLPIGRGGFGSPAAPRCRSIAAAHGHRLPGKAISAGRSVL
jgi:DNA-3-methyladenine glycosylase